MADVIVPVAAVAAIGMIGFSHWQKQPGNLYTDKSQVVGSHPGSQATDYPNVLSSAYDPPALSGVNSQIPNPRLKAPLVQVPHTTGPTPYAAVKPDSNFKPPGTAAALNTKQAFKEIEAASYQYLKDKPVSVPVSPRKLFSGRPVPNVEIKGRAQQYLAAADVDVLASIPVTRPSGRNPVFNPVAAPANYARAVKSYHYGTLLPGTKPAVYMHKDSPHTSPSPWTRIYTGRHTKVTY